MNKDTAQVEQLVCSAAQHAMETRTVEIGSPLYRPSVVTTDSSPRPAPAIHRFTHFTRINNFLLENIVINGNFRMIRKDRIVIKESLYGIEDSEIRQSSPASIKVIDDYKNRVGVYAFNWPATNFYHWLMQCLTSIESVVSYRDPKDIYLILPTDLNHYQRDSLRLLGYDQLDYFIPEANTNYHVNQVELSEFIVDPTNLTRIGMQICQRLKNAVDLTPSRRRKIYVSRVDANFRRATNEQELIETLRKYGFDILVIGCMNLEDQIKAFHHAEFVMGTHGQGMAHVAYCCPGAFVWELFPEHFVTQSTVGLAATCGLRYHATSVTQELYDDRSQTTDFYVDIDFVEKKLQDFGLYKGHSF